MHPHEHILQTSRTFWYMFMFMAQLQIKQFMHYHRNTTKPVKTIVNVCVYLCQEALINKNYKGSICQETLKCSCKLIEYDGISKTTVTGAAVMTLLKTIKSPKMKKMKFKTKIFFEFLVYQIIFISLMVSVLISLYPKYILLISYVHDDNHHIVIMLMRMVQFLLHVNCFYTARTTCELFNKTTMIQSSDQTNEGIISYFDQLLLAIMKKHIILNALKAD